MNHDEIVTSTERLTRKLITKDRQGTRHALSTVGEAAQFIHANFSGQRSADLDWKLAATSLEMAARTEGDFVLCAHATKAVAELLKTERLLDET
jgi:hypothetical protein